MMIASLKPYRFKTCKLCNEEKLLAHFGGNGVCISPICMQCEHSLPPVLNGQRRCLGCLACVSVQEYKANRARCKACHKKRLKSTYDAEKIRERNLRNNYGLTLEDYNIMLFQQGYVCAVCKQEETVIDHYTQQPKSLSVDHDHETGKVRQLLCTTCNQVLGNIEKDSQRVKLLIKYLKKHQS